MINHYVKVLKNYPDFMSLEQMRIACNMSKKTARLLLQSGTIPCEISDKKTHKYNIAKVDILIYLKQNYIAPEKSRLPEGSYSKFPQCHKRDFYTMALQKIKNSDPESYHDLLSLRQASELSGISTTVLENWARENKCFYAFRKNNAYVIPKLMLVEFLARNSLT